MKIVRGNSKKKTPKKLATVSDLAIRVFINDLLNRGQIITFNQFCKDLGFKAAQQVRQFLQQKINFPKPRLDYAIKVLVEKYGANEKFLMAGSGDLYKDKPYVAAAPTISQTASSNILNMNDMKQLQRLLLINEQLKERIAHLEKLQVEKTELLDRQSRIIEQLTVPKVKKSGSKSGSNKK